MRPQLIVWFLSVCSTTVIYVVYKAAVGTGDTLSPQGCRMSWMYPEYILQQDFNTSWTPQASRYSLWLYREGDGWDTHRRLTGNPVLFIPGNAGSSHQVRSIASSSAHQYFSDRGGTISAVFNSRALKPLDVFAVEFNEDFSAFHAPTLESQREYVLSAISYILSKYPDGTRIFLLGHSMGGIVATSILPSQDVSGVITMSSPHSLPPVRYSSEMEFLYDRIRKGLLAPETTTPIISICGGATDLMIASETCKLYGFDKDAHRRTVFTNSMDGCWTGVGHQVSVWCHQVRWRVARAILEVTQGNNDAATFETLSYWLSDRPISFNPQLKSPEPHLNWETVKTGERLTVHKPNRGAYGYLLTQPTDKPTFTLHVSGGAVAGRGPYHRLKFDIELYRCSGGVSDPVCSPIPNFDVSLRPNPQIQSRFPSPGEGVDESDGVVTVQFESIERQYASDYVGVVLHVEETSETSWVIAEFLTRKHLALGANILDLLWTNYDIPLDKHSLHSTVELPDLRNSPLLVYRLKASIAKTCQSQLVGNLLIHSSPDEQHFYPVLAETIFLHSHNGGPFLPAPSRDQRHISFHVSSSLACPIDKLSITIDYSNTIGRWAIRYFGAAGVWAIGIVGLMFSRGWRMWQSNKAFPSLGESLLNFIKKDFLWLSGLITSVSFLPLPETLLLGNRGDWVFAPIGLLLLFLASGSVCSSWMILELLVSLLQRPLRFLIPPQTSDSRNLSRSFFHVAIICGLVIILMPYQVVFVVCFLVHMFTCVMSRPLAVNSTPPKQNQDSELLNCFNQKMHLLLLLFWLLPNMAPSIAVWIRTIATAGTVTLFNSDHSIIPIISFLSLVEIASSRRIHFLSRTNNRLHNFATTTSLYALAMVPMLYGARYPYQAYNVAALSCLFLLTHCFPKLTAPS